MLLVVIVEVELEVDAAIAGGVRREPGLDGGGRSAGNLRGFAPLGRLGRVDRAGVAVEADDEDERADRYEVARGEFRLTLKAVAVDERAVARAQVAKVQTAVGHAKFAVPSRHARDGNAELAVGPAAHDGDRVIERDLPLTAVGSNMDEGSVHAGRILVP